MNVAFLILAEYCFSLAEVVSYFVIVKGETCFITVLISYPTFSCRICKASSTKGMIETATVTQQNAWLPVVFNLKWEIRSQVNDKFSYLVRVLTVKGF